MLRIIIAVAALAAGCGTAHIGPVAAPITTAPVYDAATLSACEHAAEANTDGITWEAALEQARAARSDARDSSVSTLQQIAMMYRGEWDGSDLDDGYAVAAGFAVGTWCIRNEVTG